MRLLKLASMLWCALALAACGGSTAFQGSASQAIVGTPPPPPVVKADPPPPPPRVEVHDNQIVISEKIQFDDAKATIKPESNSLLDEIVASFQKNAQIKKVSIDGFASSEGDATFNKKLSDDRAKAVMAYLVAHGVDKGRVTAKGYGADKPIADNSTEDGREKNRRVEFNIVEQEVTKQKVEIDPKTGKEKVVESTTTDLKAPEPEPAAMSTTEDKGKDKGKAKPKAKANGGAK
jgi:outer membrane protein OmpA-like peptidoglycan-associated protein